MTTSRPEAERGEPPDPRRAGHPFEGMGPPCTGANRVADDTPSWRARTARTCSGSARTLGLLAESGGTGAVDDRKGEA